MSLMLIPADMLNTVTPEEGAPAPERLHDDWMSVRRVRMSASRSRSSGPTW